MKKTAAVPIFISAFTFFMLHYGPAGFAEDTSASQVLRSQEILQEQEELLKRLEQKEQFFIKKIIVKGAQAIGKKELKTLLAGFKQKWLTRKDIDQLIKSIEGLYRKLNKPVPEITYSIKKHTLILREVKL